MPAGSGFFGPTLSCCSELLLRYQIHKGFASNPEVRGETFCVFGRGERISCRPSLAGTLRAALRAVQNGSPCRFVNLGSGSIFPKQFPQKFRPQASARGLNFCGNWSGREDLNLRPPAPHAGTLPGCATPRVGNVDLTLDLAF